MCPMASGGFTVTLSDGCGLRPEFVVGLLNSKLLFWRLRAISNVFRGGWITCTKQYFGELPIWRVDPSSKHEKDAHDQIVVAVQEIIALTASHAVARTSHESISLQRQIDATDAQIDRLVYELYGLTEEEIGIVEEGTR